MICQQNHAKNQHQPQNQRGDFMNLPTEIVALIASSFLGLVGYVFSKHEKAIGFNRSEIDDLSIVVKDLELKIINDFIKKAEHERFEAMIEGKLNKIEDKQDRLFDALSKKQDR